MDVHSPKVRSYNMSRIRAKDTKPEIMVRSFLHRSGFRFRLHKTSLPGKPDIVLKKHRAAVFINGCFWHGHKGCRYFVIPKTRQKWWMKKILSNRKNDRNVSRRLKNVGFNVTTIWECQLRGMRREVTLRNLLNKLAASSRTTN